MPPAPMPAGVDGAGDAVSHSLVAAAFVGGLGQPVSGTIDAMR